MPGFWGADSLDPLTTSVQGTNLADWVINHQYSGAPHDQIVWWGRYFDDGENQSLHWQGDSEANDLSNAVRAYNNPVGGKSWILPIAAPYNPYNINGSYSAGFNAGNYVGGVIKNHLSSRLRLPGNFQLYVYLDMENNAPTNVGFLSGWGAAVDGYQISGGAPLFPCVYINPHDSTQVSLVEQSGYYFAAWSSEPSTVTCNPYCDSPGPSWGPVAAGSIGTHVWQYGLQKPCATCRGQPVYVDLDQTDPGVAGTYGFGMCDNMLFIPA